MSEAMDLIKAERQRQIDVEGWSADHDDSHDGGSLLRAGVLYMNHGVFYVDGEARYSSTEPIAAGAPMGWPWDAQWWKPKDRKRNLERAGALMLAEKERLSRVVTITRERIDGQRFPVKVSTHGVPSRHVDQKLAIVERELTALLEPKP